MNLRTRVQFPPPPPFNLLENKGFALIFLFMGSSGDNQRPCIQSMAIPLTQEELTPLDNWLESLKIPNIPCEMHHTHYLLKAS